MTKQFISEDIQEVIANQVNKTSVVPTEAHEVGLELLQKVAALHNDKYGFVPTSWQEAIDFAMAGVEYSTAA